MDTIQNYLDTMFSSLPMTEEVMRAKEELFSMMEDKYHELKAEGKTENEAVGTVISEFGNLDEVAESLGYYQEAYEESGFPFVSFEQAADYIEKSVQAAKLTAFGVFLCICSPILLVFLNGIPYLKMLNENVMTVIGLVFLFLFIAIAVVLFIVAENLIEPYKYLKKQPFEMDFSTRKFVEDKKDENMQAAFSIRIIGGVCCGLAVIPLLVLGILFEHVEMFSIIGVCLLLFLVAVGVFFLILSEEQMETYSILLQEKKFSKRKKETFI